MDYVVFSQCVSIFTSGVTCANNVRNKKKIGRQDMVLIL